MIHIHGDKIRGERRGDQSLDGRPAATIIGLRKLTERLAGVAEVLGREINLHVMTPEEFRKRLRDKEHFVASIMQEQKLFVTGSSDELAAMAGQRLAEETQNEPGGD